jgi:hypothetical protein
MSQAELDTVTVTLDGTEDTETVEGVDDETESDINLGNLPVSNFTYKDVDNTLKEAYNYENTNNSMICDIIAVYVKGQKILFTEAKTLCEMRLNYLMLPTIVITALCTVISTALKEYSFNSTLVSSLNGLNFFFLALINYLKLDAKAEAYRISAYKFDKLQSKLEFASGKILFIDGEGINLPRLINDAEKAVHEIKETNQFVLPEHIRYTYPNLCNINVFSEVKRVQTEEIQLINELKDILNEHFNLNNRVHNSTSGGDRNDIARLAELDEKRKDLTDRIINIRNRYLKIDSQFEYELDKERKKIMRGFNLCGCLKT